MKNAPRKPLEVFSPQFGISIVDDNVRYEITGMIKGKNGHVKPVNLNSSDNHNDDTLTSF